MEYKYSYSVFCLLFTASYFLFEIPDTKSGLPKLISPIAFSNSLCLQMKENEKRKRKKKLSLVPILETPQQPGMFDIPIKLHICLLDNCMNGDKYKLATSLREV